MGSDHVFLLDYFRRCQKVLSSIALGADTQDVFLQLQKIVESMEKGRIASVLYLDKSSKTLHSYVENDLPGFYNDAIEGVEIGEFIGCCGSAVYLGKTVIADDIQSHPNWKPYRELTNKSGLRACWSVPIALSDGSIFGSFAIYSQEKAAPSEDELEILSMAAHIGSVAIEKSLFEEKLKFAATHDVLTHLLNRTQFEILANKMLLQLELNQLSMSLLFFDLNNFKEVNDQYGHDVGDKVLILFAQVLESELRESDIVCRRGGDEFLVGLTGTTKRGAEVYLHRVCNNFQKEQNRLDLTERVNFSVGISEAVPSVSLTLADLIRLADQNMYKCKEMMREDSKKRTKE
ncbi:diguanylate cyclase [Marinomonas sp. 2405UD68-3]|uniref:sensor domain-containing diguanylate cyclase n=1 Tax=Marinomonas sp. 2405UD68-3 TaxID=3391835 RepID=UPI0039C9DA35